MSNMILVRIVPLSFPSMHRIIALIFNLDVVDYRTQTLIMIIYIIVLVLFVAMLGCMVKSWACCENFLVETIGCRCCERIFYGGKINRGSSKKRNWWLRIWSYCTCLPLGEPGSERWMLQRQFYLLSWKRVLENSRSATSSTLYYCLPLVSLIVIKILYGVFTGFATFRSSGMIEVFATPLLFSVAFLMTTGSLVGEKASRLLESMRIMSLRNLPYWGSYFVIDAILQGLLLAALMTLLSAALGLYWVGGQGKNGHGNGSYGELFILLYFSIIALTTLSFALSSCFDSPQASSMMAFFVLVGSSVFFFVIAFTVPQLYDTVMEQILWCLVPPIGLQIGLMTRFNHETATHSGVFGDVLHENVVDFGVILGMLVLDMFLYSFLAWYLGQVVPSEYGVTRAPWFLCQRQYWFSRYTHSISDEEGERYPEMTEEDISFPYEEVDRSIAGDPSVVIDKMRKTFGSFVAVKDLTLFLYEGECLALLGHNGVRACNCSYKLENSAYLIL